MLTSLHKFKDSFSAFLMPCISVCLHLLLAADDRYQAITRWLRHQLSTNWMEIFARLPFFVVFACFIQLRNPLLAECVCFFMLKEFHMQIYRTVTYTESFLTRTHFRLLCLSNILQFSICCRVFSHCTFFFRRFFNPWFHLRFSFVFFFLFLAFFGFIFSTFFVSNLELDAKNRCYCIPIYWFNRTKQWWNPP